MVDVDAIRAMIDSDPAVRAQEARIASEARNAASLQVDKQMAEASDAIRPSCRAGAARRPTSWPRRRRRRSPSSRSGRMPC